MEEKNFAKALKRDKHCALFLACGNSRFSSLFAAEDVSRGITSPPSETSPAAKKEENSCSAGYVIPVIAENTVNRMLITKLICIQPGADTTKVVTILRSPLRTRGRTRTHKKKRLHF